MFFKEYASLGKSSGRFDITKEKKVILKGRELLYSER